MGDGRMPDLQDAQREKAICVPKAAARDGWFKECIVILKAGENLDSLRWVMAECRTCRTPSERKPYVFRLPSRVHGRNEADLLKQLDFEYLDGKLVAKGWASDGGDIVFERDQTYSPQPSFNCGKAQHPREKAICASPQLCLLDRKSTRLNSSHLGISYAVFCLKKKKTN